MVALRMASLDTPIVEAYTTHTWKIVPMPSQKKKFETR
jgi:hypothetical protein